MLAKEFNKVIVTSQIQSFIFSFTLCFFITVGIFRSFRLGIYSMVPLLIPITLDFGIMGSTGIKLNAATATVASIDIGLGIDYCIHFLSRYRHEIKLGRSVDQAIDIRHEQSGRAIIYNALAVSAGFLVLVPSQFVSHLPDGHPRGRGHADHRLVCPHLPACLHKALPPEDPQKHLG